MSKLKKLYNCVRNPKMILYYLDHKGLHILNDEEYIKLMYKEKFGKYPNLEKPEIFNEKLQWLKLYDRDPEYTKMVDKYEVKKYVASIIGEEYIIPTLGIYDKFDDIDFEKLPNKFVIKCTHDSGSTIICKDKNVFNVEKAKKEINRALKVNYYYFGREWPYKNVKPRIIIEKYMVDESGTELKDYKIFNFNGISKMIQVDFGRFKEHKRNLYDTNWNYIKELSIQYPNDSNTIIKKPENLEMMIKLAQRLSQGIPHLRTDFYSINGKIYFGELTFYHGSGLEKFNPETWNRKFGDWIDLNNVKTIDKKKG